MANQSGVSQRLRHVRRQHSATGKIAAEGVVDGAIVRHEMLGGYV